jgi:molybdate transport system substrate-binding protein
MIRDSRRSVNASGSFGALGNGPADGRGSKICHGRAAVAALEKAGIYDQVKGKLVYGETISQAAQFVQSGNAQAGIVAMSLAVSPGMKEGKRWEIPVDMHPSIAQAAIRLKASKNKTSARAFLEFLKSEGGRATLSKYGFTIPGASAARPSPNAQNK